MATVWGKAVTRQELRILAGKEQHDRRNILFGRSITAKCVSGCGRIGRLTAMDRDHDDRINPAELQAFLGREEDGAESATYRLSVVDQDGDGELSDEELRRGLGIRFTSLDSNKDGNVDLGELEAGFGVPVVR